MEYLIGVLLSVGVLAATAFIGFQRDRAFFPTVLIVVATYYVLFAAMGANGHVLGLEILAATGFSALAAVGFRRSLWLVAFGTAGHGVFDLFHHLIIANPGVPRWWPGFCMAFDVIAGAWIALRLLIP